VKNVRFRPEAVIPIHGSAESLRRWSIIWSHGYAEDVARHHPAAASLVGSNAWWLYNTLDFGVTHTYAMQVYDEQEQALSQALSLLPVAVRPNATRDAVIAAARRGRDEFVFDKDGFTWVGRLGLRFDADGRLLEARQ